MKQFLKICVGIFVFGSIFLGFNSVFAQCESLDQTIIDRDLNAGGHSFSCQASNSTASYCKETGTQYCIGIGTCPGAEQCCICNLCKEGEINDTNGECVSALGGWWIWNSLGTESIDSTGVSIEGNQGQLDIITPNEDNDGCDGVKLNTNVPFIGNCIVMSKEGTSAGGTTVVNQVTAFPRLMGGLSKIMVTAILIFSFILVIAAGVLMTTGGAAGAEGNFTKGRQLILKVIAGLALLGASGVILKLINPNFFG